MRGMTCLGSILIVALPAFGQQHAGEAQLLAATPATAPAALSRQLPPTDTLLSIAGAGELTTAPVVLVAGTYAVFHTSEGDFIVSLFRKQAPNTVKNFVELATGKKRWKHPITMIETDRPVYNNTTIYRTIENSMIFGGDPINKGQGDTGAVIDLEVSPELKFDKAGILAMDTNGSKSSGSRWFITLRPFPDRTGNYTILGHIIGGLEVVRSISLRPTKKPQVPLDPALLSSIEIVQIPEGKKTTATYATEDGKRMLSVAQGLEDAKVPAPAAKDVATTAVAVSTTSTISATTGTDTMTTEAD